MDISVLQEQIDLPISSLSVQSLIIDFLKFHNVNCDELAVHLVDTPTICKLHAEFFDDPSPTDCITFPMDDEDETDYRVLGEVFICPHTAILYVAEHGGDPYQEATLYVVHGLLHLIGFDDINEEDRVIMRQEEQRYLTHAAAKNLWLHSS